MAASNPRSDSPKAAYNGDLGNDFLKAASNGDLTKLKSLAVEIGNGKGLAKIVNSSGVNALHMAAGSGKTHICKYLLEKLKFDIDSTAAQGNTPLLVAIERYQLPTAVYLIETGANIGCANRAGFTALHAAAITGQKEIMRLLLSKGAEFAPNPNTSKVYTPLQCACLTGMEECVKLLLENGADPNATIKLTDYTPLMISVDVGSIECVDLLLKAGADPSLGSGGKAPLIVAGYKGDRKIIKRLLKAGADPNVVDSFKWMTPLEHAALYKNDGAVKTLFPFTSRISSVPDWSVSGIMKYVYSDEAMAQLLIRKTDYYEKSKAKGLEAFGRKDYHEAIYWYSEAERVDPSRIEVVSNRSLCWAKLDQGLLALKDAEGCVAMDPKWPKGHYRVGAAQMLLHNYSKAAEAFAKALKLDPNNKDIKKAHREAVEAELVARMCGSSVS